MPNSRSFLSNAIIFGIGGLATQVAAAILLPLYTHYLTPADYGVLDLLQRSGNIIGLMLLGNGVQAATFSFYCQAKTTQQRQQTFSTIAVIFWSIIISGGLIGCVIAPWLAQWLEIADERLVMLGIAVVFFEGLVSLPLAILQARIESVRYVVANLLIAITRMLLIIIGVAWLGLGVWGVLVASAITFCFFGISLTQREILSGFPVPNWNLTRQVIQFALPLLPSGIMALALTGVDRYFLLAYASIDEVGVYSLGSKIAVMIPSIAITPLWKVWTAALYDYYAATNAMVRVGRVVLRILAVQVFVALGVSMLSNELVQLLTPTSYASAASVIPLLAIAGTLQLANNLLEGAFWSQRKTQWKPLLMACSSCVAIISFFLFVPALGGVGAAVALVVAYATQVYLTFVVTQRIFPVQYQWGVVAVGVGLAVAIYLASQYIASSPWGVASKIALWLAWPLTLWMLGIVNEEEQRWILGYLKQARRIAKCFK